jgi:hypothetical protein
MQSKAKYRDTWSNHSSLKGLKDSKVIASTHQVNELINNRLQNDRDLLKTSIKWRVQFKAVGVYHLKWAESDRKLNRMWASVISITSFRIFLIVSFTDWISIETWIGL